MSRVTNVILHHSIIEDQETEDGPYVPVVALNQAVSPWTSFQKVDQHAGGRKVFEADVYLAAFNHVDTDEILRLVKLQPWKYPEDVQVFVKEEEDDGFVLHGITEGKS